ncbi:MAG: hypothetical protein L6W00_16285 [Lentisphaeria bacterium]|nr:MAG: hypothetical protein L6W00_16285 [Lentisphaeria bacterium]
MKYNSKAVRLADVIVQDIWSGNYDRGKYLPGRMRWRKTIRFRAPRSGGFWTF